MRKKIYRRVCELTLGPRSIPLALFLLCLLAYAPLLRAMGFYWDDWPWVWINHTFGAQGMLNIDSLHRPLSGEILWLGAILAGDQPLRWQFLNLVYRWLTGIALFWALLRLWPRHVERNAWVAFLFVVYPGFKQQFVAVNTSRHLLPLAFFFVSIGLMAWAVRDRKRCLLLTGASIGLALLEVLSSDYYMGLELTRPLILWFCIEKSDWRVWRRLKTTFLSYLPFLAFLLLIFTWRYGVSRYANYPVTILSNLTRSPSEVVLKSLKTVLHDFMTGTLSAWSSIFEIPTRALYGLKYVALYAILVLVSAGLAFAFLLKLKDEPPTGEFWRQAVVLGLFSVLVAGLPFLMTGIPIDLSFPFDRATLPMMFGVSMLFVSMLDILFRRKIIKIALISSSVGLAVGMHLLTAISFQKDWNTQRSFLNQLVWRIPDLEPGTAIYYAYNIALKDFRSTDNSLTAPLNWIYAPDWLSGDLPYELFDLRLRLSSVLPENEQGLPILDEYGNFRFRGSTDNVLVISFDPPGCMHVLNPQYDKLQTELPDSLIEALAISNLSLIDLSPDSPVKIPANVFGEKVDLDWCYYFEEADLARQQGDWWKVVEIGEEALKRSQAPKHFSELAPFIQAYAHVGIWDQANQLTLEALKLNNNISPYLCSVWSDLAISTPDSDEKLVVLESLQAKLDCVFK